MKKTRADSRDRKQTSITSPNGSSTSNGDNNYDFDGSVQMEDEDDVSVGSPFEQHQQQLPPLRPVNEIAMGPPGIGMMYSENSMGLHAQTNMAKYHLDRKFQSL